MRSTSSFVTSSWTARSKWTCSTPTMSSTRTIRFTEALRHVLTLIKGALDAPETPLGDIEMLSAADRSQLDTFAYGGPINA